MARKRDRGDPAIRAEMLEVDRLMLKYAEWVGAEKEQAIFRRHIAAIESGRPFNCRIRDLPGGISYSGSDLAMVRVNSDGSIEEATDNE